MDRIFLETYDVSRLDSVINPLTSRANIYFDNVKSKFTVVRYKSGSHGGRLIYSDFSGRNLTPDDVEKHHDYHDEIDVLCNMCVKNEIGKYFDDKDISQLMTIIVDMQYIPEIQCVNFITAGYRIGIECMQAYLKNEYAIDYILNNKTYRIEGDTLRRIACKAITKDINDSSSFGYSFYNKTLKIRGVDKTEIDKASRNDSRFGSTNNDAQNITNLMRYFTEYVPIAFSWSVYTPVWVRDEAFMSKLKNNTILGLDWVEVQNFSNTGNNMKDIDSVTCYTTRKRLYEIFGFKFEYYNFQFINRIISGLYLGSEGVLDTEYIMQNRDSKSLMLSPIEAKALTADEEDDFDKISSAENARVKLIQPTVLIKKFWSTMSSDTSGNDNKVIRRLSTMNMGMIATDVERRRAASSELFGYVN